MKFNDEQKYAVSSAWKAYTETTENIGTCMMKDFCEDVVSGRVAFSNQSALIEKLIQAVQNPLLPEDFKNLFIPLVEQGPIKAYNSVLNAIRQDDKDGKVRVKNFDPNKYQKIIVDIYNQDFQNNSNAVYEYMKSCW